ncbi:MAG: TlyA family RNA methyltransferase [Ruminococcaceae bacterium]|nr:TlyA family RNA methyltransferase [Oscillospiraceae bacterium]
MMRADIYLAQFGYAKSRQSAKTMIEKGSATIDGRVIEKPSEQIDETVEHNIEVIAEKYVCRGALKLEGALEDFSLDVTDMTAIDIGASTGGFTDVLLKRGARKVYAVDSGHGQLDTSLDNDSRVVNVEGYNARYLKRSDFPYLFDIAVMDVSFISQTYIHSGIADVLCDDGILISLIKPQFEAGRSAIGKNGIVKKREDREAALMRVIDSARSFGLYCRELMRSPIDGGDGNIEYLALFTRSESDNKIGIKEIKAVAHDTERRNGGNGDK